jgi:hypothetical protein
MTPLLEPLASEPSDEGAHAYARSLNLPPEAFREALAILACAEAVVEARLSAALGQAMASGTLVPPLAVVAGELELANNPREALGAAAEVVAALVPASEAARAAAAEARAVPAGVGAGSEATLARIHERLRRACEPPTATCSAHSLDSDVGAALRGAQRVEWRELFGAKHARARLHCRGASYPLAAYLPADATLHLPQIPRFGMRALVEVHPPQDPVDPGPIALRIVALAREAPRPRWQP